MDASEARLRALQYEHLEEPPVKPGNYATDINIQAQEMEKIRAELDFKPLVVSK